MSYESFKAAVNKLVKKAGGGISVRFNNAGGKYFADFITDDVTIIGNPVSTKVTVRWNYRNHQSMVNKYCGCESVITGVSRTGRCDLDIDNGEFWWSPDCFQESYGPYVEEIFPEDEEVDLAMESLFEGFYF